MSSRRQQQNEKLVKAAKAVLARRDFAAFVDYVIKDDGNDVKSAEHQKDWRDHLNYCWQVNKDAAILSPYSFAKTVWMAIALPLWLIGRNPNLKIILVSSAEDIAAKRLQEIQRYILESPEYHEVFPHVQKDPNRQWNNQAANVIRTSRDDGGFVSAVDHSISAFGYTAKAGNGARADVVIFDDVVAEANSATDAMRQTLYSAVTAQWIPRGSGKPIKDREGRVICPSTIIVFIGTRYHVDDLYASLLLDGPEAYCTLIQAVSEDFEKLNGCVVGSVEEKLHPAYIKYGLDAKIPETQELALSQYNTAIPLYFESPGWELRPPAYLKRMYAKLGSSAFERGFRQKPFASGDKIFPHLVKNKVYFYDVDWRKISDEDNPRDFNPESPFYVDPTWSRYTGCDLGGKSKRKTAIFTIAVSPEGTRHVLDIKLGKWDGYNFGLNLEKTFADPLLRAKKINVENNALQDYAIDVLREMAKHDEISCFPYIKPFTTGRKKMDAELGLPSIDVQYQNQRWVIAIPHKENQIVEKDENNTAICSCAYCIFIRTASDFTIDDLDNTPDTVMAQYFAKEASRLGERFSLDSISIVSMSASDIKGNATKQSPFKVDAEPEAFNVNRIMGVRNPEDELTWFGTVREGYSKKTYSCESKCGSYTTRRGFNIPEALKLRCGNCGTEKYFS